MSRPAILSLSNRVSLTTEAGGSARLRNATETTSWFECDLDLCPPPEGAQVHSQGRPCRPWIKGGTSPSATPHPGRRSVLVGVGFPPGARCPWLTTVTPPGSSRRISRSPPGHKPGTCFSPVPKPSHCVAGISYVTETISGSSLVRIVYIAGSFVTVSECVFGLPVSVQRWITRKGRGDFEARGSR